MAKSILMPQVGQDLTEGRVVAMNVKVGDNVKKGDMVAEVESEKRPSKLRPSKRARLPKSVLVKARWRSFWSL